MAFLIKTKDDVLTSILQKLQVKTQITASAPGSVARSISEAIAEEFGNLYSILDFNMSQTVISTAYGRALDLIGVLYNVTRKTLTSTATIDKSLGVFYFYLDTPATTTISIPLGTKIYTNTDNAIGLAFGYETTENIFILPGRTRVYTSIRPIFSDAVFTAGSHTITTIDPNFAQPVGVVVKATNPKPVQAQLGFEDDESYRTRIIKAVRTSAGGTLEAVRFAGLNVSGVRDILIRDVPYGLGSYEAIIVSEDNIINGPVIRAAANAMERIRPVGVRMYVKQPDLLPFSLEASIIIRSNVNVNTNDIARRTEVGVLRYINTLLVGTPLIYNQLIQTILDATDVVSDVVITNMSMNGVQILRRNFIPESDQQIIPGSVTISVAS